MNKKNKLAVLYLHHCKDDVTLHNYDRLKKFNPDVDIYPVGFEWHDLIEGSHIVHRHDELPNNNVLNNILKNGTSSESDLYLYDFFLHHQGYESYFVIEWDTYCNASIGEVYGEAMKRYDTFSAYTFTNEFYGPGTTVLKDINGLNINNSHDRYVRRWSWYRYFFLNLNEPTEQNTLLPYLGGTYPTSLLYYKHRVLRDIVELILNNPRLYDNIQNEMRLGTILQQAGYKLNEYGADTNQFIEQENYRIDIENNIKGYYHPIKDIIYK